MSVRGCGGTTGCLELFDDLEQQAEGLALAERDARVAERCRAEYAEVDLVARLHASVGTPVQVEVRGRRRRRRGR